MGRQEDHEDAAEHALEELFEASETQMLLIAPPVPNACCTAAAAAAVVLLYLVMVIRGTNCCIPWAIFHTLRTE